MVFIEFNALQTSSEAAVAGVAFDTVEDTNPWNDGTVSVVLGFGLAIDGFDDTNPWKDCVSLSSTNSPTPITELDLSPLFGTVDAVWMGDIECLEVFASRVDTSDVERLEVSASCVDASAELERLEMSRSAETLDNSAAERLEESTLCVDASAAELERLEMPGLWTVDNSAACDLRLRKLLADDLPVGGRICSGAPRGEQRQGTYLPHCRSKLLAAESAPTLANWDKVAETRSSMYSCRARVLVAGVDAGPGDMEGAHIVNNSGQKINENYFTMEDWNELLNTEDQLGPLPSWKSSGLESPMGMNTGKLVRKDVQGLMMPAIFEEGSDLESVSTSDHTDSDEGPVIFCGMGKISVVNDSQDTDESTHGNDRHRHAGSSKQGTMHGGTKKHKERSSSDRRKVPVKNFKRENSEIPEGDWFRATTAALSSSSSSGSDDPAESGSSDTEELGKSSNSSWKSVMRGVKIKKPFTFDGRADLDLFDQWTYEVDTWREWNGISDKMVIKILVNFMSGKASRFFMKHVALRHKDWTLKSIYEALFNYCFPPDFKLQLREQLTGAKQGKNDVRDFQRDLETLAVRFPDVTEREIRQIFWTGIRSHLRLHLIEKGLDPERSSIQKLVKYASRREAARKTLKREREGLTCNPSPEVVHSTHAATDQERSPSADEEDSNPESEIEPGSGATAVESAGEEEENEPPSQFRRRNSLPQDEYLRLRQEGRCFKCKNKGHLSRNCPEAEPNPPVEVLAARFADHEESDRSSEQNESEDDEIRNSGSAGLRDTDDEEESEFSEENSNNSYSDSSDDSEYYVGALRVDLRSDRGHHRLEGETETIYGAGLERIDKKSLMQRSTGGRFVRTSLEGRM
ncbi:hypothetical protein DFH06DRAFT_1347271 [Mycena polygramma]|nr:hypothetical protein DFH06DRAFT_1347271 [Mycena polygramma]